MIVNKKVKAWEIYFQRAHGLLAAKIAFALKPEYFRFPQYYLETINAIAEHDNGQPDWSTKPHLNDKGEPLDFREKGVDLDQAKRTVNNSKYKSSWQALLTSLHTSSLYEPYKNSDKEISQFLKEQEEFQQDLYQVLNIKKELVQQEYKLFRLCDELSLLLCEGKTNEKAGKINEETLSFFYNSPGFCVEPWCFQQDSVTFSVEKYTVEKKQYTSNKDLWKEIERTNPEFVTFKFNK